MKRDERGSEKEAILPGFDYTSRRCIDARSRSPFLDLLKRPSRSPFNSCRPSEIFRNATRSGRIGRPWPPISPHGDVSPFLEPCGRGARLASVTREPLPGLTWKTSRYKALPGLRTTEAATRGRRCTSGGPSIPRGPPIASTC